MVDIAYPNQSISDVVFLFVCFLFFFLGGGLFLFLFCFFLIDPENFALGIQQTVCQDCTPSRGLIIATDILKKKKGGGGGAVVLSIGLL